VCAVVLSVREMGSYAGSRGRPGVASEHGILQTARRAGYLDNVS
jgi:hypothetical protein